MPRTVFIINSFSYRYIQNIALFVHQTIKTNIDPDATMLVCDRVDDAEYAEGSLVFLIGETFLPFSRRPGCRYIYLNFSVVTILGNPLRTAVSAHRTILRKRRMLANKLPLIDVLLDYYPPQTKRLQKQLDIPVLGFDVATQPKSDAVPISEREYDVCFVGHLNQRRIDVCNAIRELGYSLSPSKDVVIEETAAQSRLCLNVHAVRSHHLETPRFVAAFATGTPVVTEHSYGAYDLVAGDLIIENAAALLPKEVDLLLKQPDRLEETGCRARRWYADDYLVNAKDNWRHVCDAILATC